MSQISASSPVNPTLLQMLQNVAAETQSQATAATSAANAAPTADTASNTDQAVQGTHHHHHGHGAMFKKLEAAVTSALQAAQSNTSADPNKVIQDAIEKFFKDNNITPRTPPADGQPGSAPPGSDNRTGAASQSAAADDSARQTFMQMLQTLGVDAQQFRKDFLAAIQDAQQGQVDSSTAFKSFPPGSSVDTTS
jgi:hypothetical protein